MSGLTAAQEQPGGGRGGGSEAARGRDPAKARRLWLIETTLLLALGLLLVIATINDVARQTKVNHRLVADLRTWRHYTAHHYNNLQVSQDFTRHSTRETVCGNTSPGPPKARVQLCLVIAGPVVHGVRRVTGGWYLPPKAEDLRGYRYGCFGAARAQQRCGR